MISSIAAGTIARRTIVTLLISAAGGAVAALLGLPAAWLMGGALAVAVAALAGVPVMLPNWLRDTAFVLTGLSMGASVARDSLALMVQWPVTLAALALEMVLIISLTGLLLRKLFGLDRGTAYLSSFPGHLSFVMSIAAAGLGDTRQIIIIQVIRILLLTICVPIGAMFLPIGHFEGSAGPPMEPATLVSVAIVTVIAFAVLPFVDMPFGQIWLGLSPGALEGMGALGIALGFDTAFIAAHHVGRLLLLTFAIPLVAMLVRQKELP